MHNTETKLRETVKALFTDNKVDMVLGFRAGSLADSGRPYFVRSPKDADRLVWNAHCVNNLAAYLPKLFEKPQRLPKDFKLPRIGITAKACDARSVIGLVKEKQVPRDHVTIIGMPCEGMKSPPKHGSKKTDEVNRACIECVSPEVKGADIVIKGPGRPASNKSYDRIKKFAAKPAQERWNHFLKEISKCIRCNACREA